MKTYKIVEILHSGRKGRRYTVVTDNKYEHMVNSLIRLDIDFIKQYESVRWYFVDHPFHKYWNTSAVLALSRDDDGLWYLETANTIYVLKEVDYGN